MKKVLAWVLTLALVLSTFAMSFAADTANSSAFSDASDINYTEAVDVMVATGIINGFPDGTFGPQKYVKRAEMAKMISVLLWGGEDKGDQYKGSCTFADSQNHWAAGYIAYCASKGIIDGRDADTFDPETNVTGIEASKMLLVALGYDSKVEGYVGADWAANVLDDADANGFFDDMGVYNGAEFDAAGKFDPSVKINRDEAAEIIFNAMKATMVEYENGTTVTSGDVSIVVDSKVKDKTTPAKYDENENGTIELYEKAFEGDLAKDDAESDDSGRPAHTWTYDGDKVGTYADEADESAVADENQAVEEFLEDIDEDYAAGDVLLNGDAYDGDIEAGDIVELFETDTKDVYDVVITRYVLAKIASVDEDVTDADADDDISAYVEIEAADGDTATFNDTDIPGFDAATYVEDAYIAVAVNEAGEIIDSYIPESKQGEFTKANSTKIYIDDTAYTMAYEFAPFDDPELGDVVDAYLDQNGYALGIVLVEEESDDMYGVITDSEYTLNLSEKKMLKTLKLTILGADGEETYALSSDFQDDIVNGDADSSVILEAISLEDAEDGFMVKFTLDADGNLDSITGEYDGSNWDALSDGGSFDGELVNEDVVVFEYDIDEEAWVVLGYEDLEALDGDSFGADYFTNDDGIAAMWTGGVLEVSEDTLGFYVDSEVSMTADGEVVELTLLVDGEEVTYTSEAGADMYIDLSTADALTVVGVALNKDGEIDYAYQAEPEFASEPSDSFNNDFIVYGAYDLNAGEVFGINSTGNKIQIGASDNDYISITNAKILRLKDDDGDLVLSKYTGKIAEGGHVIVLQMNEDSDAWDTIIYVTKNDWNAMGPILPPVPAPVPL